MGVPLTSGSNQLTMFADQQQGHEALWHATRHAVTFILGAFSLGRPRFAHQKHTFPSGPNALHDSNTELSHDSITEEEHCGGPQYAFDGKARKTERGDHRALDKSCKPKHHEEVSSASRPSHHGLSKSSTLGGRCDVSKIPVASADATTCAHRDPLPDPPASGNPGLKGMQKDWASCRQSQSHHTQGGLSNPLSRCSCGLQGTQKMWAACRQPQSLQSVNAQGELLAFTLVPLLLVARWLRSTPPRGLHGFQVQAAYLAPWFPFPGCRNPLAAVAIMVAIVCGPPCGLHVAALLAFFHIWLAEHLLCALPWTWTAGEAWIVSAVAWHGGVWALGRVFLRLRGAAPGESDAQTLPVLVVVLTLAFCLGIAPALLARLCKGRGPPSTGVGVFTFDTSQWMGRAVCGSVATGDPCLQMHSPAHMHRNAAVQGGLDRCPQSREGDVGRVSAAMCGAGGAGHIERGRVEGGEEGCRELFEQTIMANGNLQRGGGSGRHGNGQRTSQLLHEEGPGRGPGAAYGCCACTRVEESSGKYRNGIWPSGGDVWGRGGKVRFALWRESLWLGVLLLATLAYVCAMAVAAWLVLREVVGSGQRLTIVAGWAVGLAAGLPALLFAARAALVRHVILRKGFHLLAIVLFVPVLVVDADFLGLALGVALALMIAAEGLRFLGVPGTLFLGRYMQIFTDSRDAGAVTVSHMSLLLGIAGPLWLAPTMSELSGSKPHIVAWAGLLTLGVADSMAAAVGSTLGRIRMYPASNKTLEGTLASAISLWLCLEGVIALGWAPRPSTWAAWKLPWISALTALLEASTLQLDNLVVPLFASALMLMLL